MRRPKRENPKGLVRPAFEALVQDSAYREFLRRTYPGLDVDRELRKMAAWLDANPRRRYKNYKRFIINWLNKEDRYAKRSDRSRLIRKYANLGQ